MGATERQYTIGCDPELFLIDKSGAFRSAHDIVSGSKLSPFEVLKGALQPDGTAAEFNITPATSAKEFCENIHSVLSSLQFAVNSKNPELKLKVVPTAWFEPSYFKSLPPEALAFGCTPDWNAYTAETNVFNGTNKPFRTGAGHVHVGWTSNELVEDKAHFFDCCEATKQLDASIYFMSLLWDLDVQRRSLYGKIGAFRPKSYGVEYRSVSNAWVADPDLQVWVFNATLHAIKLLDQEGTKLWEEKLINEHIEDAKAGVETSRADLIDLHEDLTALWGFPALPESYTDDLPF